MAVVFYLLLSISPKLQLQALILLARLEQFFDSVKAANRADIRIVAARRAVFPTEENDLQVQFVPAFFGNSFLRSASVCSTFLP
jgi:hypothetical protein